MSMSRVWRAALCGLLGLGLGLPVRAAGESESPIRVRAQQQGDAWTVEAEFTVPAPPARVWAVLTDFDRMETFVPNLESSRVVQRQQNRLVVEQKGRVKYGPLGFSFESVRAVELFPMREVHARSLSGSMKRMESVARILPEGELTRVRYHAAWESSDWWGQFVDEDHVRGEITRQFEAMRLEMLRRKEVPVPAPTPPAPAVPAAGTARP